MQSGGKNAHILKIPRILITTKIFHAWRTAAQEVKNMSKYKSFSLHKTIYNCRKAITTVAAGITAAALPIAIFGIGTVGAVIFKISDFSAASMAPNIVSPSSLNSGREMKLIAEASPEVAVTQKQEEKQKDKQEDKQENKQENKQTSGSADSQTDESVKTSDSAKGAVKEKQIKNTGVNYGNIYVKDGNSNYDPEIRKMLNTAAKCKIKKNAGYQVLLVHTHTTEGYADSDKDWYDKNINPRTTDKSESVVAVADEIENKLNDAGIKTLHVTTYHDYPEYTGAYNRARETIKSYLAKYPSIEMVIDVHRDSMTQDDGTKIKPTVTINGKKAAQVMIISGCDNDGTLNFSGWRNNLAIATQLQKQLADDYEGLARPLYFAPYRYNMDLTPNSLLIEFGTDVNTLSEAKYSGKMVGESLVKVLEGYVVD